MNKVELLAEAFNLDSLKLNIENGCDAVYIGDELKNFSIDELKKSVIGDICGRFIDENNQVANVDIQTRTISIDLNNLKNIPYCIAVACGRKKKHIARAAIKGGFVNVLMTDEALARALLED